MQRPSAPCYTKDMLRRFLYSLLVVITLQLSWSVITAYCMHETGQSANHIGHHQHNASTEELSLATESKQPVSKKVAAHDAHCASYAQLALATPDALDIPFFALISATMVSGTFVSPASVFLSPPERPQWISHV